MIGGGQTHSCFVAGRVHVAALVPSPLSPLGPKDNRLVKSFSHVTVSD